MNFSPLSAARRLRAGVPLAVALLCAGIILFRETPAITQDAGTVRFAVIGDYGKASWYIGDVANRIKSWNPDFVVTTGDNNYELGRNDTLDANIGQFFHEFIGPYTGSYGAGSATNRFFPSLGNHDWGDGFVSPANVTPYTDYFNLPGNERYYDVVKGPVHLFAVDADPFEPDGITSTSVQASWLQGRLSASTAPWKIVYFHLPPYSSSAHASGDAEANMRWPFRQWGATAVMVGHHHVYERLLVQNTPYFITGLGGYGKDVFTFPRAESRSRSNVDYGAMLVTASASRVTFEFITRAGVLVDGYSIDAPAGPGAPNNLVAQTVPAGPVGLWWTDNAADEQGFVVARSDDGENFTEMTTVGPNVTSYTDPSVSTPATYYYRVHAFGPNGPTAASNVAVVATAPALPAPSLTATSTSSSAVDLTWSAISGATGARVYRDSNGTYVIAAELAAGVNSYTDPNRSPSTAYTYVVRGVNDAGESPSSNAASATTLPKLQAPTGLTATAVSASQINLSWTDNTGGTLGFKVLRSTDGTTFSTAAWVNAGVTTYANTGRTPETTYYYQVRAYEPTGGESLSSNTASATTLPLLGAPGNLSATAVSTSRIDLTWTDNSATESVFRIFRSTDGVNFAFQGQVNANVTTYSNSGLSASTRYYYKVTARESGGAESAFSNVASAMTLGLPQAPTGLVADAVSSSQIDLTWTDNSGNETGYKVDRSSDGANFTSLVWLDANTTSYSNTGRSPSTTYYYRVSAYNAQGSSQFSNVASATTPSALAAPSNLSATAISGARVDLAWVDNSTGESGFKVYRSTDNVTFTFLGSSGANATTYSNGNAQPGTTYYYRVLAYDSGGAQSAPSNTVTVTTPNVPAVPTNLVATAVSKTQITLTWADNSNNETNFRIDRSTNGNSFSTLTWTSANVTSFTDTGRQPGTTYYYRVASYNAAGSSNTSNTASATTLP